MFAYYLILLYYQMILYLPNLSGNLSDIYFIKNSKYYW